MSEQEVSMEKLATYEKTWLDNAFWETPQKQLLNAICEYTDEKNRKIRKVLQLPRLDEKGVENPVFNQCVEFLSDDAIDASTAERRRRKLEEAEVKKQKDIEKQKAKKLEKLFEYKLETFEIDEIKNSKNRQLKSKLRRAKSIPEVNLYAMLIIKDIADAEQQQAAE
jgi:hypothetical protein